MGYVINSLATFLPCAATVSTIKMTTDVLFICNFFTTSCMTTVPSIRIETIFLFLQYHNLLFDYLPCTRLVPDFQSCKKKTFLIAKNFSYENQQNQFNPITKMLLTNSVLQTYQFTLYFYCISIKGGFVKSLILTSYDTLILFWYLSDVNSDFF